MVFLLTRKVEFVISASHYECQYQFLKKIPGTINNIHYHSGQKVGYVDGLTEGVYHHLTAEDNAPSISWGEGYTHGWSQGCRDSGRMETIVIVKRILALHENSN